MKNVLVVIIALFLFACDSGDVEPQKDWPVVAGEYIGTRDQIGVSFTFDDQNIFWNGGVYPYTQDGVNVYIEYSYEIPTLWYSCRTNNVTWTLAFIEEGLLVGSLDFRLSNCNEPNEEGRHIQMDIGLKKVVE